MPESVGRALQRPVCVVLTQDSGAEGAISEAPASNGGEDRFAREVETPVCAVIGKGCGDATATCTVRPATSFRGLFARTGYLGTVIWIEGSVQTPLESGDEHEPAPGAVDDALAADPLT
jgi:hypothetical protein